ncbi:hypothetical protein DFQ28_008872 [Apophysomyces sp. BC1034]|nr:hypothetical protein DFQ30_005242 [Apophysomyces sp. BC1015]KAG0183383.1 hypothetical protein DFQ29_005759 [Apophysomyces sp. BC1021]KAG0194613.1 hypothetical protein DFQ28_008872 [Apophysomyces sp. BC1034]
MLASSNPINSYETLPKVKNERSIRSSTVGPEGWLGESPKDLEAFIQNLRPVDQAFLKVLPQLHEITDDYTHVPVPEAFNWNEVAALLGPDWEGDWFIVAFRSVRKASANSQLLYEADAKAQREAAHSGGLLKYWYGDLNQHRECLAMCVWRDWEDARKATKKPLHRIAAQLASEMYESYGLERYSLTKKAGELVFHLQQL